jgi:hypothetical protein
VRARVADASRAEGARIALTVEQREDGFSGELVFVDRDGARGARAIRGETCAEVSEALVFFAGLAIELGALEEEPATPESKERAPLPPVPTPPPALLPLGPLPPKSELSLEASLGARGGIAPTARPFAALALELASTRRHPFSPSARLSAFGSYSHLEAQTGRATLLLVGARLDLCPLRIGSQPLALRPCVAFEAGPVFAEGETEIDPKTAVEPWLATEATLRLSWRATAHFFAELELGLVVPLQRSRFYLVPDDTLYVVPALTGRGALGAGWIFD